MASRILAAIVLLIAACVAAFVAIADLPPVADEPHHVAQVRLFMLGRWQLVPALTTLPGYHLLTAAIGTQFGRDDITSLRLYSFVLSIGAIASFFAMARYARDGRAVERGLQIVFLPLLFPLLFVVYTDVAALLFLSLALLFHESRREWLAAAAATLAIAVRQNYIVWFGYAALLVILDSHAAQFTRMRFGAIAAAWADRSALRALTRSLLGYAAGFVLFVAFVTYNNGIAIGDRDMHPFPSIHLANVFFALFLIFFLFLPLHVANARQIIALVRRPSTIAVLIVLGAALITTFRATHPYNQPSFGWFLHNKLLAFMTSSAWVKVAMCPAVAASALSLAVTPLRQRWHYLIYPMAVVSLLPAWQIEQRYYLPILVLFLLYREQRSLRFEWVFIGFLVTLAAVLFRGISRGAFFM